MTVYSWAWVAWLVVFVAIEAAALLNKKSGDTLTEHIRRWASIGDKGRGWRIRRVVLLAFLAWLLVHMMSDDALFGGQPINQMGNGYKPHECPRLDRIEERLDRLESCFEATETACVIRNLGYLSILHEPPADGPR